MSTQRFGMAAALLHDGHVLVVGGTDMIDSGDVTKWPISFGEIFDPATGAFSRTGPMVQARQYLRSALTLPDGRVVILGGSVPDAPSGATGSEGSKRIAIVELYDPATGVFRPGGSLLVGRDNEASVLLRDGRVLVTGGWGPDGPIASAEIYDPSTGTSEPIADMTTPRAYHSAVLLADGRVLIVAGNGPGADSPALDSVEIFDPADRTFAPARAAHHGAVRCQRGAARRRPGPRSRVATTRTATRGPSRSSIPTAARRASSAASSPARTGATRTL